MSWEGCGRKRRWPNLRHHPVSCLKKLRKSTNNLSQVCRYDAEILTRDLPYLKQEFNHSTTTFGVARVDMFCMVLSLMNKGYS
jgi:hypothetical protein